MLPPTHRRPLAPRFSLLASALTSLALLLGLAAFAPSASAAPIEDYASYQPATTCSPKAKRGTTYLGHWMVRQFGGSFGGIGRSCTSSTSEHEEGRAFDWTLDATKKKDRRRAREFLTRIFATDDDGNQHALARRMGVMYVIWNDHMYASYERFDKESYLSSSCSSRKSCSKTLRHRDHVHVSQTRAGGKGRTSWFAGRLDRGAPTTGRAGWRQASLDGV